MIEIDIQELETRLEECLRRVRAGEIVLVTQGGEVVAELRQPGNGGQRTDLPAGLVELVRRGRATLPERKPEGVDLYPRLPRVVEDGTVQRILEEDRGPF